LLNVFEKNYGIDVETVDEVLIKTDVHQQGNVLLLLKYKKRREVYMIDYNYLLQVVETQEKLLQFENFSNEMALDIGIMLVEKAKNEDKAVTIDITRNG
jgi:penicillin-binding protein-related factor A (putative recombinase)